MNNQNKTLYYEIIVNKCIGCTDRYFISSNADIDIMEYAKNKFNVPEEKIKLKYLGDNQKAFSDNAFAEPIKLSRTEIYKYANDKEAFYDMIMSKINLPPVIILNNNFVTTT